MVAIISPAPGTVSIAAGDTAVVGTGTTFTSVSQGSLINIPSVGGIAGGIGQFETITDDEHATLVAKITDSAITDASYQLYPQSDPQTYSQRVRQLLETLNIVRPITPLTFDAATGLADPGPGKVRFNDPANPTIACISYTDVFGNSCKARVQSLDDVSNSVSRATLGFMPMDDANAYADFDVTGAITDETTYAQVPVALRSGTVPSDGASLGMLGVLAGADANMSVGTTDNALVRTNGTSGNAVQGSVVIVDDSGEISGVSLLKLKSLSGPTQQWLDVPAAGVNRQIIAMTNGVVRWVITMGSSGAESGGNVGSDFSLAAYDDSGALLSTPISISRSTGLVTIPGFAQIVSTATDLNTFLTGGNFVTPSTGLTNLPPGWPQNRYVVSVAGGSSYAVQTLAAAGGGGNQGAIAVRTWSGAAWSPWVSLQAATTNDATDAPMGRLSLSSGVSISEADVTGATTIYYVPNIGGFVPVYDGYKYVLYPIGTQLSLALDATSGDTGYHQSGKIFDIFAFLNGGVITLGTGPAWTSDTARSAALAEKAGLLTNSASITLRYGNATGNTATIAAGQATYLGSFYATANGQASDTKAKRLLYNAYNQCSRSLAVYETAVTWEYHTGAWRQANGNTANQVDVLIGLAGSLVELMAMALTSTTVTGSSASGHTAIGLDSTTAFANDCIPGVSYATTSPNTYGVNSSRYCGFPGLGHHYLTWLEYGSNTNLTWYGTDGSSFKYGMNGKVTM